MSAVLLPLLLIYELIQVVDSTRCPVEFQIVFKHLKSLTLKILKEELTVSCLVDSCFLKPDETF